jgi:hypothetical protein
MLDPELEVMNPDPALDFNLLYKKTKKVKELMILTMFSM